MFMQILTTAACDSRIPVIFIHYGSSLCVCYMNSLLQKHIVAHLGCVTIDRVRTGEWIYWPLVYTTRNYNLQFTDTHILVSSVNITVFTSRFPATASRRRFSFQRSGPLVTAARTELLSNDNSTNRVLGWRPIHTNLLVFSLQADFHLN
jgi:hypothetical protein